jgi:hypothetical protein
MQHSSVDRKFTCINHSRSYQHHVLDPRQSFLRQRSTKTLSTSLYLLFLLLQPFLRIPTSHNKAPKPVDTKNNIVLRLREDTLKWYCPAALVPFLLEDRLPHIEQLRV